MGDVDEDGIVDLMVKFGRPAVHEMLSPGYLQLTVGGTLILDDEGNSVGFEGIGIVYVMDKGNDHINELNAASVQY